MESVKKLVDAGVTLDIYFKRRYNEFTNSNRVKLYFSDWKGKYTVDIASKWKDFDSFEKAYPLFLTFLDPKVNPGIAFSKAFDELEKKYPDMDLSYVRPDDEDFNKEMRDIIAENGWALEYRS